MLPISCFKTILLLLLTIWEQHSNVTSEKQDQAPRLAFLKLKWENIFTSNAVPTKLDSPHLEKQKDSSPNLNTFTADSTNLDLTKSDWLTLFSSEHKGRPLHSVNLDSVNQNEHKAHSQKPGLQKPNVLKLEILKLRSWQQLHMLMRGSPKSNSTKPDWQNSQSQISGSHKTDMTNAVWQKVNLQSLDSSKVGLPKLYFQNLYPETQNLHRMDSKILDWQQPESSGLDLTPILSKLELPKYSEQLSLDPKNNVNLQSTGQRLFARTPKTRKKESRSQIHTKKMLRLIKTPRCGKPFFVYDRIVKTTRLPNTPRLSTVIEELEPEDSSTDSTGKDNLRSSHKRQAEDDLSEKDVEALRSGFSQSLSLKDKPVKRSRRHKPGTSRQTDLD